MDTEHEICEDILCNQPKCTINKAKKFEKELKEVKKLRWQQDQINLNLEKINERKMKLIQHLSNHGVFTWA